MHGGTPSVAIARGNPEVKHLLDSPGDGKEPPIPLKAGCLSRIGHEDGQISEGEAVVFQPNERVFQDLFRRNVVGSRHSFWRSVLSRFVRLAFPGTLAPCIRVLEDRRGETEAVTKLQLDIQALCFPAYARPCGLLGG